MAGSRPGTCEKGARRGAGMKIPDPGKPESGRAGGPDSSSMPILQILCLVCDYCTKGTHFGEPELYCLHQRVRDLHADCLQLIAPRLMVQYRDAWALCGGEFFKKASKELALPVIRRKSQPEKRQNLETLSCQFCGLTFKPGSPNSRYCSPECSRKARSIREKARRDARKTGDPR